MNKPTPFLHAASAALGLLILSGCPLLAQSFTSNGLGTRLENPPDLALQNIQFTETVQPDTRVLVEITADLQNTDSGQWRDAEIALMLPEFGAGVVFEVTDSDIDYGPLAANATVSPDPVNDSIAALVEAADVAAFRDAIANGEYLVIGGFELLVFTRQPMAFDEETGTIWEARSGSALIFTADTPFLSALVPGQLLVEDLNIHNLPNPRTKSPLDPNAPDPPRVLAEFLPFEVTAVTEIDGKIHVAGSTRILIDVLQSGTIEQDADDAQPGVRPFYDPPVENTYTEDEQEARDELALILEESDPMDPRLPALKGLSATPFKFSDIEITPVLKLSGEVLLQSSGLRVQIKIRNFAVQRAVVGVAGGIALNSVIEVSAAEDNSGQLEEERSVQIAQLPLPPVVISIAGAPIQLQPVFTVTVGAEVVAPTKLAIPLQSAVLVELEAGWDRSRPEGDRFFYDTDSEIIPLRVSEPSVFDEVAVTASAFAEAALDVYTGPTPTPSLLGASTGLAIRTVAEATVAPLSNPWWSMEMNLELLGRFGFDVLGIDVADAEATLATLPLFQTDAGGPLIPSPGRTARGSTSPTDLDAFRSKTGRRTRWARAYQPSVSSGGNESGFAFFLPDVDDEVLAVNINPVGHAVTKFTAEGELLWSKTFQIGYRPRAGVPEPGGGFTIAGIWGLGLWLASFDNDGVRQWFTSLEPGILSQTEALLRTDDGNGNLAYYLAGHVSSAGIRESDPAVLKFDGGGNLVWAKYYATPNDDEPRSLIQTADGDIVLCGTTEADVAPPPEGTPNSDVLLFNATPNLMLMKIAAADGALRWANTYVCRSGSALNDLVEAPDGSLYACGEVRRPLNIEYPVNLAAHFAADGELIDHILIGDSPDHPDDLPTGGNTPFDHARGIEWCGGGLYLCGTTGLGRDQGGWVASLSTELGVQYYAYLDGPWFDSLVDLDCSDDGILVTGQTDSVFPWGAGGSRATLLASLPFEGKMGFQEVSGLGMEYMQPRAFHSSDHVDFRVSSTIDAMPPITFTNDTSPSPFVTTVLPTAAGTATPDLSDFTLATNLVVEDLNPGAIQNYTDWATFHQLPVGEDGPSDNHDNDALDNGGEFYFGGTPFVEDAGVPHCDLLTEEIGGELHLTLEVPRSTLAAGLDPILNASTDLEIWNPLPSFLLESIPIDDQFDLLRLSVPIAGFPRRFLTIEPPELGP